VAGGTVAAPTTLTGVYTGGITVDFSTKTVVSPFTGLIDGQTKSVFVATVVANEAAAVGNTGKDVLINVERVIGTVGNDRFILTDAGQSVWGGEGTDTVVTGLQSFSLRTQVGISIENLETTPTAINRIPPMP
jgi:hypothetical protein